MVKVGDALGDKREEITTQDLRKKIAEVTGGRAEDVVLSSDPNSDGRWGSSWQTGTDPSGEKTGNMASVYRDPKIEALKEKYKLV